MIRSLAALAVTLLCLAPAAAQEDDRFDQGGDRFAAGGAVAVGDEGLRDVFAVGERVSVDAPVAGAAHLAGRRVETAAEVGGALYAFGGDVTVGAPVAGAASLLGYDVALRGPVGGNLRALGNHVAIDAPVAGAALIAGDAVEIGGVITGDATIAAETLTFGPDARIDGRLTLYAEPDAAIDVPASVVPPDRLDRRALEGHGSMSERMAGPGWAGLLLGFVMGALVLALFAALAAAFAPRGMARLAAIVGEGPFRAFGYGFLTQATLTGAAILLVLTIVGVILAPFVLIATMLLGLIGYVVAVFLLGEWIVLRFGALDPDGFPEFFLAGLAGAFAAGLLALVPFVGWFATLALTLIGVGALTIARLRPRYGV